MGKKDTRNRLRVGLTRTGKSEAARGTTLTHALAQDTAIVAIDPHGTMMPKLLLDFAKLGMLKRVIYDRLSDTDLTPSYDWLVPSKNPDPYQRVAQNEQSVRDFVTLLMRRRGILSTAKTPFIEEGLMTAGNIYINQSEPARPYWLPDLYVRGSDSYFWLPSHCTDRNAVMKFYQYAELNPMQWRTETGPAERILRATLTSPAFMIRSAGASYDFDGFLKGNGILLLDGSSKGNLSKDAAGIMFGSIILRVIDAARAGRIGRCYLLIDEASNANLIGLNESLALAECGKWGLEFDILIQTVMSITDQQVRDNVLQNCWFHEWFRQGSPDAAELAAQDIATPILDPLKIHHMEYRTRRVEDGLEEFISRQKGEQKDEHGKKRKSEGETTSYRPKFAEVTDEQARYTSLQDQIKLIQRELMRLEPGWRFVRGSDSSKPEYVKMEATPWDCFRGLAEVKFEKALAEVKRGAAYRKPSILWPSAPQPPEPPPTKKGGGGMK